MLVIILPILRSICNYNTDWAIMMAAQDAAKDLDWDVRNQHIEALRLKRRGESCNCRCWWAVGVELKLYPPGEYHEATPKLVVVSVCPDCLAVRSNLSRSASVRADRTVSA